MEEPNARNKRSVILTRPTICKGRAGNAGQLWVSELAGNCCAHQTGASDEPYAGVWSEVENHEIASKRSNTPGPSSEKAWAAAAGGPTS